DRGHGRRSREGAPPLSGAARTLSRVPPRSARARPGHGNPEEAAAVTRTTRLLFASGAILLALVAGRALPARAEILVPMDETQTDHLRAYGLAFWTLQQGLKGEWLLNYRGGSFLLPDEPRIASEAAFRGVKLAQVSGSPVAQIRAEIADNETECAKHEAAPRHR